MRRLIPLLLVLASCDDRPRQWDAFIYEDAQSDKLERINGFKTFELCQEAAQNRIYSFRESEKSSYSCGYMCGPNPDHPEIETCKEKRE